jgi:plasmid stability protein
MISYAIISLTAQESGLMASLIVRRLDDDLVRRLKARARAHGRSAEAEHRAILEAALRSELTGRELWQKLLCRGYPEINPDTGVVERIEMPDLA